MLCIYCTNPQCAQPTYYSLNKPNLCGFCGRSFSLAIGAQPPAAAPPQPPARQQVKKKDTSQKANIERIKARRLALEDDEDDTEIADEGVQSVPQLSELEYDVVGARPKMTFENLAKQAKTGFAARPVEKISQEEAIRRFQEEAKGKTRIELDENAD
jgi:hypothetical protein